ncbi:MAG: malto-oligosyltrehalose synthase [Limisphaerales bacterium]
MSVPRATYRMQFHAGFTLRDALGLVPYLDDLGVSHLYASPLLKARRGSPHGYDTCDPSAIEPDIGDESDLETLAGALHQRGMGLILDIVPNHMAASPQNPWWRDVLKQGRASRHADAFDIDWNVPDPSLRGRVLLPILGDEIDQVLSRGELVPAVGEDGVVVRYFDHSLPTAPESLPSERGSAEEVVAWLKEDSTAWRTLLDRQHYRLAFWRHGDARLNYRRFFTITDLVGARVELPRVFEATHRKVLEWHRRGWVDGFRVDHPDGLWDPKEYFERLRTAAPKAWIVVEKILETGEDLPEDWPVAGTTGYDFLARALGLFVDPGGKEPLTDFYAAFTGEPVDYLRLVREKKRWMLRHGLEAEVVRLARLFREAMSVTSGPTKPSPDLELLRDAVLELGACFPVYRTYVRAGSQGAAQEPIRAMDSEVIRDAVAAAWGERPELAGVLEVLQDMLLLRTPSPAAGEFAMRFQQLTGPAMAKGAEDTACYCYNRLVALNEVGGNPAEFGLAVDSFHRACQASLERWPDAMLATSTHDTKRGEDVRMRLAQLSEIPDRWREAVARWSRGNEGHRRNGWPDRNTEYLYYQTLVGAWPLPVDRAIAYMEKAVREAKLRTDWTAPVAGFEEALREFITRTLEDPEFVRDVARFVAPLARSGMIVSIGQTLLKLVTPGVPDIYQGTEIADDSLVDPDNRRPVDFARRQALLTDLDQASANGRLPDLIAEWVRTPEDGRLKLHVIRAALAYRKRHPDLFRSGRYLPLEATGSKAARVVGCARLLDGIAVIAVIPRWIVGLATGQDELPTGEGTWGDTRLELPEELRGRDPVGWVGRRWLNLLTGERVDVVASSKLGASIRIAEALRTFPVALLAAAEAGLADSRGELGRN